MTKSRKTGAFGAAAALAKSTVPTAGEGPDMAGDRMTAITKAQKVVKNATLYVDPDECRLWDRHNRNFERLNETNCRDLIESFISSGKQEIPAIVRRTKTPGDKKYEIITGARRFWTVNYLRENNYPTFQYFIEVRDLTDEEAFRLSNLENLDRADISPYERAMDYKDALAYYYNGKQLEMAKRLNKTEAWVSRYITLSKLPIQIPNAYADWAHLKLTHAPELLKLVTNKNTMKKVLEEATELHAIHRDRELDGEKPMSGAEVFSRLKAAAMPAKKTRRGGPLEAFGPKGTPHLELKSKNKSGLSLYVPITAGTKQQDLVKAFRECLKKHYKS